MTEPTWPAKPRLRTAWPFVKESLLTVMLDQRVLSSGNTRQLHKVSSSPVGEKNEMRRCFLINPAGHSIGDVLAYVTRKRNTRCTDWKG